MRAVIAVLASIPFCGIPIPSFAQNLNGITKQHSGKARSEIARSIRRTESEWNKLPQSERICVNQKLSERGESVQSLVRRAILPSDTRVADLRSQCRALLASAHHVQSHPHRLPTLVLERSRHRHSRDQPNNWLQRSLDLSSRNLRVHHPSYDKRMRG